jgi:hypothetical protein
MLTTSRRMPSAGLSLKEPRAIVDELSPVTMFERVPPIVGEAGRRPVAVGGSADSAPEAPDSLLTWHFHGPPLPETLLPRWAC